jgi:hypothetical protein
LKSWPNRGTILGICLQWMRKTTTVPQFVVMSRPIFEPSTSQTENTSLYVASNSYVRVWVIMGPICLSFIYYVLLESYSVNVYFLLQCFVLYTQHIVSLTPVLQFRRRQVAKFFFGNSLICGFTCKGEVIAISPGSFLYMDSLCRKQFREFPLLPVVCRYDKLPAAAGNLETALVGERPYFCYKWRLIHCTVRAFPSSEIFYSFRSWEGDIQWRSCIETDFEIVN